jgi:hypothetical protein
MVTRFDLYSDLRKKASEEAVVDRMLKTSLELKELQRQVYGRRDIGFKVSYRA